MILREIRCDRFAGLQDRDFRFEPGLNLIIGENESGKSTLADLLYSLFFQDARVGDLAKQDKLFKDRCFPKSNLPHADDTVDGEVIFDTDRGRYRLTKEWAKNGSARLRLPDGAVLRDSGEIRAALGELLGYGKGVYDELVFPSRRRSETVLRALLGQESSPNVSELSAALSQAVMETGGIDIEGMEAELRRTAAAYEGRWDFANDMPEGGRKHGIDNKWARGVGSILAAWYKKEEIARFRDAAEAAERAVEDVNDRLRALKEAQDRQKEQRERFHQVQNLLAARNAHRQLLQSSQAQWEEMEAARRDWPERAEALQKAEALREELRLARLRERRDRVGARIEARDALRRQLQALGEVPPEAIRAAFELEAELPRLEASLKGLDLRAQIRPLGAKPVEIRSAVTGEPFSPEGGTLDITEAVDITVPGAVEIRLSPRGVNADEVRARLAEARDALAAVLTRYQAASSRELKDRQEEARALNRKLADAEERVRTELGNENWDALASEAAAVPSSVRPSAELAGEITALCGRLSLEETVGRLSGLLDQYETKYGDLPSLTAAAGDKEQQLSELRRKLRTAEAVPEEFSGIADPDAYARELRRREETGERQLRELREELLAAERALDEHSAEDYAEDYRRAAAEFESQKAEHLRWQHILSVFLRVKDEARGDPLADVEAYFRENLALLSGDTLRLDAVDEDLGSRISSGSHRLTADILSDGTKDTISLAFRLAVLRHLFPEGGCVAVFDDPFTDMDPERCARACGLIQRFAENNQVIFATCDEKYTRLLRGHEIPVQRQIAR